MEHELKIETEHFINVVFGNKTFEIRKNDRDFKPKDILNLREWNPIKKEYTGQAIRFMVTYIHDLKDFGIPDHVVMAIIPHLPTERTNPEGHDIPKSSINHETANSVQGAVRLSCIKFAEWILKEGFEKYEDNGKCWWGRFHEEKDYSTDQLYEMWSGNYA